MGDTVARVVKPKNGEFNECLDENCYSGSGIRVCGRPKKGNKWESVVKKVIIAKELEKGTKTELFIPFNCIDRSCAADLRDDGVIRVPHPVCGMINPT